MGKCNCFDVKMELATDMEKRYLTVNKNGVLQLVGNYEVNVQVPSENIANDLLITDVYHSKKTVNSPACYLRNDYGDIMVENICKPYELYLSFNNLKLLWDKRNELYLGVYKKSCSAKRFSLINDKVIHDERLKLYCYSYNDGGGDYYFYTLDEWSLEDLISEDPSVFIHRQLDLRTSNGTEIDYNNYAISLNELYEYDELCVSDVTGGDDASFLFRHEDKDLDCYYENAISKNTVEMCFSDGDSKFDVVQKVLAKSVRVSSDRYVNNYYSGRFPITPIPLGDLLVRYQFYDNDIMVSSWKRLNDFTDDEFNKLMEVVIKLPFDEGYLFSRLLKPDEGRSYINLNAYSSCKRTDGGTQGGSKLVRWGGGSRYKPTSDKSHPFVSVPVSFSILTADEIKHRPKPNNHFIVKIKQYTTGEFFIKH